MQFDFKALLQDPQFQTGMGLFGLSSQRNAPMFQAYQMLQQQRQAQMEDEKQKQEMEYRQAQIGQFDARTKAYLRDIAAKEAKSKAFADALARYKPNRGGPSIPTPSPQTEVPQPLAQPAPTSNVFGNIDSFIAQQEGGYVANDAGKGPTFNGINQTANPDIDVKALSTDPAGMAKASAVRKQRYWDALSLDRQPPETAIVAYDAAVLQGQSYAMNLLKETGGDPSIMLYQRKQDLRRLAKSNPMYAESLPGWEKRLDSLQAQLKNQGATQAAPQGAQADPFQQYRQGLELSGEMKLINEDVGAFKDLAEASKPQAANPGQTLFGPGGVTTVPDPLGQRRVAADEKRNELTAAENASQAAKRAADLAKTQQDIAGEKAKIHQAIQGNDATMSQLKEAAAKLKKHPGLNRITGKVGSLVPPRLLGDEAMDAAALLETLQSKVFVQGTLAIRQASPTGSGVGNQSNQEGEKLQNAITNVQRAQTYQQIVDALTEVENIAEGSTKRIREAYKASYGEEPPPVAAKPRTVVRTGKKNGRKWVQYSDGTQGYGD